MDRKFKLPIKSILNKKDSGHYDYHYTYYSGNKDCEIIVSLLEKELQVSFWNKIDDYGKEWIIKTINQNSLDKLQERIDKYIEKSKWDKYFYNSWEELIKDSQHKFENASTEEDKIWFLREINSYKNYLENEDIK